MTDVDTMDGVEDNGLQPNLLRGLLGALDPKTTENESKKGEEINIVVTPRYRR